MKDTNKQLGELELPVPACTYADHSYPAFTSSQMKAYAALVVAAEQSKQRGEPKGHIDECGHYAHHETWQLLTEEHKAMFPISLYTSQTTATQAAVAAAMLKCAELANAWVDVPEQSGQRARFFHEIQDEILASIPADHMQALRELLREAFDAGYDFAQSTETGPNAAIDRILAERGLK